MGEILEEGDKDDEQKKEGGDGQEGTEKITTEKKEAGNEDAAAIKDVSAYVNNSDHITYTCTVVSNQCITHYMQV